MTNTKLWTSHMAHPSSSNVSYSCARPRDQTFSVRPVGTHEERRAMYKNGASYIGKMLTVKYQELSNDGVPRFPVGLHIREDWDMGGDQ